jgi:hypothetical protein
MASAHSVPRLQIKSQTWGSHHLHFRSQISTAAQTEKNKSLNTTRKMTSGTNISKNNRLDPVNFKY